MKETTKRQPIFEGEDGMLYEKQTQRDALRNPSAIREIVGSGEEAEVRWLVPIGTTFNSDAEAAIIEAAIAARESQTAKANSPAPNLPMKGSK